jgi:NADPH:quinone reductase-like Zn-dependent oxidoreductase
MKAAVYTRYGPPDVVQIIDVDKPVPKDNEVLLKVRAVSVNPADWRLMRGAPYVFRVLFRLRKPTPAEPSALGSDVAGQVEVVGRNVSRFKPGDAVFGTRRGALAEYVCASESALIGKPGKLTFEEAASVPVAAVTALQGLRDKGRIQPSQKVLINGAAGGVGTFAVQIAKSFGAEVTGVSSTKNVDMVQSLGADRVIDYTREDFTKGAQQYDLILDNVGNHSLFALKRVLKPKGICVIAGAPKNASGFVLTHMVAAPVLSSFVSQRFLTFIAKMNTGDLTTVGQLMATGKVKAVIDKRYRLTEAAEALGYLESGHARGKVIINFEI